MEKITKKTKINWFLFQIIALQWLIFAMLMATISIIFLLKERQNLITKFETCEHNWELVEKQLGSGRVILELK